MRIGIDARPLTYEKPAGISRYLYNVITNISENIKDDNEYYLFAHREIKLAGYLDDRFRKIIIPGRVGTLWCRYGLNKELKKYGLDVFWGTEHIVPKRLDKSTKSIVTVYDLSLIIEPRWGEWKNSLIQNTFAKSSIRGADRIIAISKSTKEDLSSLFNIDKKRIEVIYCGMDQPSVASDSEGEAPGYNYFLYLGTIEPRKNVANIVKAFEDYKDKSGTNTKLVIAGRNGWKYKPILKAIDDSRYNQDIIRLGYITNEEKNKLLKHCKGFVFPSYYEGFGIPVLEAMQFGVPVITTRTSSLPEVAGDAGFYLDNPDDVQGLSDLLVRVDNLNDEERELASEKGIEKASGFSWAKCAEETHASITTR